MVWTKTERVDGGRSRTWVRNLAGLVALAATSLALAACGGGATPSPSVTAQPSTVASASPSALPSVTSAPSVAPSASPSAGPSVTPSTAPSASAPSSAAPSASPSS